MSQKRTHVIACADAWLKDAGQPTYTELLQKVESMNATAAQPLDLDELAEIEAIALAAPKVWYGTYQIVDGISDEKAVALVEACSPDTILALIAQARTARLDTTASVSIKTWQERRAEGINFERAMLDHIADLQAALQNIVANAAIQPDASMGGATDCYAVPLDDIDNARQAVAIPAAMAEAVRIEGEPEESFYRRVVYANGWNACREAIPTCAGLAPADVAVDEQALFEAWLRRRWPNAQRPIDEKTATGSYAFTENNLLWEAWQARATLAPVSAQQAAAKEPAAQADLSAAGLLKLWKDAEAQATDTMPAPFQFARMLLAASPASTPEASQQAAAEPVKQYIGGRMVRFVVAPAGAKVTFGPDENTVHVEFAQQAAAVAAPSEPVAKADLWDAIHQYVSDYGDQFRVPPTTGAGKRCNASRDELAATIDRLYAAPTAGAATTSEDARDSDLTSLLQAAGAMRMVRAHDGSGEPFAAYDKAIADRVVAELRTGMHGLEDRIAGLRVALKEISEVRFGWDGDCGVTRIADDALFADDEAQPK